LVFKYRGHRIVLGAASQAELQRLQAQLKTQSAAIEWLDSMAERPAFLDVGADAGLHSLYAAVARKGLVIAVEPDGVRRSALTENIAANQVAAQVTLLPIPLSDGGQGLSVDQLVASGSVPQPTCIRIGSSAVAAVVLKGAAKALADPRLVGVLIDLQPGTSLDSESSQLLETAGWVLDGEPPADQTMRLYRRRHLATPWARQPSIVHAPTARGRAVLSHVLQRVAAAPVIQEPFPYAVIDDILPADYYAEALEHFPTSTSLRPLSDTGRVNKGAYEERLVVLFNDEDFARMSASQRRFWRDFAGWMYSDVFLNAFVAKFASALGPRLDRILASSDALRVRGDALLVNDQTNYAVGPHTDAPHRLVTFLFYLPKDDSMRDLGTSVYRPKDSNFVCWGGPHHPFEKFEHVRTVEFLPNRLLAFPKTEKSFHGVERIEREGINRPLLINNIRLLNAVTH
jgi:FkbM family methyltransferase